MGGKVDKVVLRSTGYSPLPQKVPVKVVRKLRFLFELIASWNTRYDHVILLEPYPHLKTYSVLVRAKYRSYLENNNKLVRFNISQAIFEEIKLFFRALSAHVIFLRYRYAIRVRDFAHPENDYTFIEHNLKRVGRNYSLRASVIVPVYNRRNVLEKTLAALMHQTYPLNLFEVIIADDGSSDRVGELVKKYTSQLEIKLVSQEDRGYRLAAIRNKAIRAAGGEVIISLDCDILPVPRLIEEYMKWFHSTDKNIVAFGILKHVDAENLSTEEILKDSDAIFRLKQTLPPHERRDSKNPMEDWRVSILKKTRGLKVHPKPYIMAGGGNMAFWRKSALEIGGFDEDFNRWGGEDDVFNYNLYKRGAYFIPEVKALGLHQKHDDGAPYRREDRVFTRKLLGKKIPLYRHFLTPGDDWEVPKVSIFIRSYNSENYIKEAIESALHQTYKDLEVCVVDDGSTDNTLQIMEEYFKNNKRISWIVQNHKGPAASMNAAINLCCGEYIGQLDSDDILYPTAVEELVNFMDKHPEYGVVYSDYEEIGKDGKDLRQLRKVEKFSRKLLMKQMIVWHFRMFRTKYWHRIPKIDEDLPIAVDYDLFLKLSEVCNIYHYDKILYRYRIHDSNITRDTTLSKYYTREAQVRAWLRLKKRSN